MGFTGTDEFNWRVVVPSSHPRVSALRPPEVGVVKTGVARVTVQQEDRPQ